MGELKLPRALTYTDLADSPRRPFGVKVKGTGLQFHICYWAVSKGKPDNLPCLFTQLQNTEGPAGGIKEEDPFTGVAPS